MMLAIAAVESSTICVKYVLRIFIGGSKKLSNQQIYWICLEARWPRKPMNNRPYTVYVRHRLLRTGFLINTDVFVPGSDRFHELVDMVMV